jgi:hypothetical protein
VCLITTLVGPGLIAILWSAIEWLFAPS